MIQQFLKNWKERHRDRWNLLLHTIGIPLTVMAIIPLVKGKFLWATALFVLGYIFQFVGHTHEKSEVGEFLWIKKLLKK